MAEQEKRPDDVHVVEHHGERGGVPGLDRAAEKRLTRKLDLFIMPLLGLLYLLSFLDRSNIGNANIASPSISQALHLNAQQYGAAVSVVYATYVVFEPVWSNLLKIATPKLVLSGSAVAWGALTLGTAWAKTYGDPIAIRVLIGVFESGLFPCITVYVLMTFRREEVARRMSYIFACSAASGAFGGLVGFGLIRINSGGLHGWQFLFIVEGILSIACAPLTFLWLPNDPAQSWFLNEEQRQQMLQRYEFNKAHYNPEEAFSWRQVWNGVKDWKTWTTGVIEFTADITLYGLSTFMPAIIKGLGFSNVNAQLLTVPVYFAGAVCFILVARLSERFALRSPFIAASQVVVIIGYVILAAVENPHGRYAGVFIVALGLYTVPGLNISWISGNTAGHYKRSTAFGLNQTLGNCAGAAIGSIFSSNGAPRYLHALYIAIGLTALGFLVTVGTALALMRTNATRRKMVVDGAPDRPELGDHNAHFVYLL